MKKLRIKKANIAIISSIAILAACNNLDSGDVNNNYNLNSMSSLLDDKIELPLLEVSEIPNLVREIEGLDSTSPLSYEDFISISQEGRAVVRLNLTGRYAYYEFFYLGESFNEIQLASLVIDFFRFRRYEPEFLSSLIEQRFKLFEGWNLYGTNVPEQEHKHLYTQIGDHYFIGRFLYFEDILSFENWVVSESIQGFEWKAVSETNFMSNRIIDTVAINNSDYIIDLFTYENASWINFIKEGVRYVLPQPWNQSHAIVYRTVGNYRPSTRIYPGERLYTSWSLYFPTFYSPTNIEYLLTNTVLAFEDGEARWPSQLIRIEIPFTVAP